MHELMSDFVLWSCFFSFWRLWRRRFSVIRVIFFPLQVMALTKRFQLTLIRFNDEQLRYKDRCKQKFVSYLKVCKFSWLFHRFLLNKLGFCRNSVQLSSLTITGLSIRRDAAKAVAKVATALSTSMFLWAERNFIFKGLRG